MGRAGLQKQMLQRIRRQHHPNFRKPWRYFVAQAGDLCFGNQYDGRRRGAHQRRSGGG